MLEKGDLITLSNNNEYFIIDNLNFEGNDYVYLISKDGISDIKICLLENDSLKVIKDENLIKLLINKFKEENK